MLASDPAYPEFDELWNMNAVARNLHMHPFLGVEMPAEEQRALIKTLEYAMDELLNDVPAYIAYVINEIEGW